MRPALTFYATVEMQNYRVKAIEYKTYLSVLRLKMLNLFVSFLPDQNY